MKKIFIFAALIEFFTSASLCILFAVDYGQFTAFLFGFSTLLGILGIFVMSGKDNKLLLAYSILSSIFTLYSFYLFLVFCRLVKFHTEDYRILENFVGETKALIISLQGRREVILDYHSSLVVYLLIPILLILKILLGCLSSTTFLIRKTQDKIVDVEDGGFIEFDQKMKPAQKPRIMQTYPAQPVSRTQMNDSIHNIENSHEKYPYPPQVKPNADHQYHSRTIPSNVSMPSNEVKFSPSKPKNALTANELQHSRSFGTSNKNSSSYGFENIKIR